MLLRLGKLLLHGLHKLIHRRLAHADRLKLGGVIRDAGVCIGRARL